jgi:hypothetical protein
MKRNIIIILAAILCTAQQSCGQKTKAKSQQKQEIMDTSKLTNATVKAAFDAWQNGDAKTFLSFFAANTNLFDDGSSRNFQSFVKDACGHEKFTSIEKVENDGKDITGKFHTESWGDFKTYFKFHINAEGKIDRLDIGQAK